MKWTNISAKWKSCKDPRVKHLTEVSYADGYQILVSRSGKVYRRQFISARMEILTNPGRKS